MPVSRLLLRVFALAVCLVIAACGGASSTAQVVPVAKTTVAPEPGIKAPLAVNARDESNAAVPIYKDDPAWGSRTAPVTIIMFTDLQCPFCSRVIPTMEALKTNYGPERLRIVWKDNPLSFHPHAESAARAAQAVFEEAGSEAFFRFTTEAFEHQTEIAKEPYAEWAKRAGVDGLVFKKRFASIGLARINRSKELAEKLGANGTPSFFINGTSLLGAQPLSKFAETIDDEEKKAQDAIRTGTAKDAIYTQMTAANRARAPKPEQDDDDDREDTKTVWKVPVGASPVLGSDAALVTIIEFSDFQCPFCSRVEPALAQVRTTYGDKVRIVWKNEPLPFHPRAIPAAELALETRAQKGDAAFWAIHDDLFNGQKDLSDAALEALARKFKVDIGRWKAAVAQKKHRAAIEADEDLADEVQASGTPHFFINGRRLVGAQPFEKFKTIIDEELQRAPVAGTTANARYEAIIKNGRGAPEPETKVVAIPSRAPSKGTGTLVIQEFGDFECPFCGRVQDTMKEVMKNYNGKVRLVWRNLPLPFHIHAGPAAEAALEAQHQKGDAGFWKMHDLLYKEQKSLSRADLEAKAASMGLDMKAFRDALDQGTYRERVQRDATAAQEAGITGTPSFIIGKYFIRGAQPYAKFKRLIDRALQEGAK